MAKGRAETMTIAKLGSNTNAMGVPITAAPAPAPSGGKMPQNVAAPATGSSKVRIIVPIVVGGALAVTAMAWALWRMRGRLVR